MGQLGFIVTEGVDMMDESRRGFLKQSLASAAVVAAGREAFAEPAKKALRVAVVGCGRLGQLYAEIYRALPETELVAIAEWNPERRKIVGKRFDVKALFRDADQLLQKIVPDMVAIITPTKYIAAAVIASAESGVKGILTDRPFAARLSDADEMVEICEKKGAVLAGGVMERATWEVEQAGRRLATGELGTRMGAAVHGFQGEICSGGTARLVVLQHFTQANVAEVFAWGSPPEKLADAETDMGLNINALIKLTSGLECQVYGNEPQAPHRGVEVWTEDSLVRWDRHGNPLTEIFRGFDAGGTRKKIDPDYAPWQWAKVGKELEPFLANLGMKGSERYNLLSPVTNLIDTMSKGTTPRITGKTQRHALEVAIACKRSAQLGSVPIKLPLEDRSMSLYPRPYRWLGGDVSGRPQSAADAAGK